MFPREEHREAEMAEEKQTNRLSDTLIFSQKTIPKCNTLAHFPCLDEFPPFSVASPSELSLAQDGATLFPSDAHALGTQIHDRDSPIWRTACSDSLYSKLRVPLNR